jgi:hypothetical protein
MNPKIRALVWEQTRVAGIVGLWCFLVTAMLYFVIGLGLYRIDVTDYLTLHFLLLFLGGVLFLFRQNNSGHLVIGFEHRLARLPLYNVPLALVPLAARCACYALYGMGMVILFRFHLGYFLPASMLLFPVAVYALVQSAVWSGSGLLCLGVAAASVAGWVLFELWVAPEVYLSALVDGSLRPIEDVVVVLLLGYLFAIAFGLSLLGIRWQRTRSVPGISLLPGTRTGASRQPNTPRADFRSVLDACLWFDQRSAKAQPVKVFFGAVLLAAPLAVLVLFFRAWIYGMPFRDLFVFDVSADALRWLPFLVVLFGAGLIGLFRDFSRTLWPISLTTFIRTKPLGAASLAWAHLLAMTRMTSVCLLVVFILSNAAYALLFPGEVKLMLEVARVSGWFRPVIFYVEPLFWACILSWLALNCLRPLALGGIAFFTLGTLVSLALDSDMTPFFSDTVVFVTFNGLCGWVLLRSFLLTYRTWHEGVLSGRFCFAFLAGHIATTLFIWWPGPHDMLEALLSLFATFALVALLLSPFVALPYRITRKRAIL